MSDYRVKCRHEQCDNDFPNHKQGNIAANKAGWFQGRWDGVSWCPEHLPPWVEAWRAKKAKKS